MISVLVDGKPFPGNISEVRTIANLIELIKLTIDPNSIITEMRLNGKFLDEVEWRASLVSLVGSTFEINTGSKNDYVHDRLTQAEELKNIIKDHKNQVSGVLRLGIIPTLAPYLLPRFIGRYKRAYPNIMIRVEELTTQNIINLLLRQYKACRHNTFFFCLQKLPKHCGNGNSFS